MNSQSISIPTLVIDDTEPVEQDTADSEDLIDLQSLLLPEGSFPHHVSQFSVSYNKKLFNGWVKQPSACCAAASVAGAINSLADIHRSDHRSLNHTDILYVYISIMERSIDRKKKSFERCLGAPIDNLLTKLIAALLEAKKLATKKKTNITSKASVTKHLKAILLEHLQEDENKIKNSENVASSDVEINSTPCAMQLLHELIKTEEEAGDTCMEDVCVVKDSRDDKDVEGDGEDENEDETPTLPTAPSTTKTARPLIHNAWDWKSALADLLKKIFGLQKLNATKASTAPIGNWGILSGVQHMVEICGIPTNHITAKLFMGKGSLASKNKLEVPLSRSDTPDTIRKQWDALRAAFLDPNRVLLFHLKNHYALIYALREWVDIGEDGKTIVVRELLTARRGQRPTVWMPFPEARETMLGWEGYKLMTFSRASDEAVESLRSIKSKLNEIFGTVCNSETNITQNDCDVVGATDCSETKGAPIVSGA